MLLLAAGTAIPTAQTQAGTILVLGDSISAAYGMDLERGWVALLQQQLSEQQSGWRVVNASISGDTSAGGLQRLPALIERHEPDIVIVELGGNDGLRGYPIAQLRSNLTQMIEISRSQGAGVLLLAMEIPPNFGARYTGLFRDSYAEVARATETALAPFILEGIALDSDLMQADGIHPTASAQPRLLDNVLPHLTPLLAAAGQQP